MQYHAWCLNNGDHETLRRAREDWNAKLLWKMRIELAYQWDLVEDEVPTLFKSLLDSIECELEYLKDQVNSKFTSNADPSSQYEQFQAHLLTYLV